MRSIALGLAAFVLIAVSAAVVGFDPLGLIKRPDRETGDPALRTELGHAADAAGSILTGRPPSPDQLAPGRGGIRGVVREAGSGVSVGGVLVHVLLREPGYDLAVPVVSTISANDGSYELPNLDRLHDLLFVFACGGGWISERGLDSEVDWAFERRWRVALRTNDWVEHDLRVRPGARIQGVVRRPDGSAAVGASVCVDTWERGSEGSHVSFPWGIVTESATDAEGRFMLDGLPPARGRVVLASLTDHLDVCSEPVDLVVGRVVELALRLTDRRRIEVRVSDAHDGRPVKGVLVDARDGASDRTNTEGLATLETPTGPVRLHLSAAGYASRTVTLDGAAAVTLVPAAHVQGRIVCPHGLAAEGITVRAEALGTPGRRDFRRSRETDVEGHFAIPVQAGGRYVISMEVQTLRGRTYHATPVEADADGADALLRAELVAEHPIGQSDTTPRWQIALLGPDGEPLAGARFRTHSPPHRWDFHEVSHHVRFESGVVTVSCGWLDVLEPRTATGVRAGAVRLGPYGCEGGSVTVRLPPAGRVEGQIVDAAGIGVSGVEVRAAPVAPEGAAEGWGGWLAFGVSDAQGHFVVDGLGVEAVDLDAWPWPDYVVPAPVRAEVGGPDVLVQLRPTVSPRIRVLLPDGRPARRAEVRVTPVAGESVETMWNEVFRFREYDADERGEVWLRGLDPDGHYTLRVDPPHAPVGLVFRRLEEWQPRDAEITLVQKGVLLGTVVDADGSPQGPAYVWLRDSEGRRHRGVTGPFGHFGFGDLPPGPVALGASFADKPTSWDGFFAVPAEPGDEDVVLVLDSARDLTVSLAGDGLAPAQGLNVRLTRHLESQVDGPVRELWTNDAGRWRFRGLDPGARYWIWAGPTQSGRYAYVEVEPEAQSVELHLVPGGVVRGRVALPANCHGAWAWIRERGVEILAAVHASGAFQLNGVPPGRWTVVVECYGTPEARSGRASASPGETVEVELGR